MATYGPQSADTAYFGVHFRTKSLDRGRQGLAKRYFKISLGSLPPDTSPVSAQNLPTYPEPGNLSFIFCASDDFDGQRKADPAMESLFPAPNESLERGKVVWATYDSARFSISGATEGGALASMTQNAQWFAINSLRPQWVLSMATV